MTTPPPPRGPRPRELGIRIGQLEPGPLNAVTDVAGVRVGHVTVWRDDPEPPAGTGVARTGVTVVVPADPATLVESPIPAGVSALNGAGELTGFVQIAELGMIETPVYLTSTMQVGRVYDAAIAAACAADTRVGNEVVVIPPVGECDDSWLNDARVQHVTADDVLRALAEATSGAFVEGAVGAGTGMTTLGWKGGIGTASRVAPSVGATLGVLVLSNFGSARDLRIDGVAVGEHLAAGDERPDPAGSCIAIAITDAPLGPEQLARVSRRCGLGLGRAGSVAHHSSGEIFLALSTGARRSRNAEGVVDQRATVRNDHLDELFQATVEATEEAVLNAMWAAPDVTGRGGRLSRGLPHADVLALLEQAGRMRRG
jgi:D-aminopeptidase